MASIIQWSDRSIIPVWLTGADGKYTLGSNATVNLFTNMPNGATNTSIVQGVLSANGESPISFNAKFKLSAYYGLVLLSAPTTTYGIYRLWEIDAYGAGFQGLPKRNSQDRNTIVSACGYFKGKYETWGNRPLFSRYPDDNSVSYNEILNYSDMNRFPRSNTSSVGGGRGLNPGNPGPGNSATTIGTAPPVNPLYAGWPTFFPGMIYPKPVATSKDPSNGGGGDKGKGQWVTGPDGKKYYLPPGIDFAALQREHDRTHPKPETKIVVRMPKGYAAPVTTFGTKPRIRQRYKKDPSTIVDPAFNKDRNFITEEIFEFPYIPQNIRYSDIGSQWQEIPRALNTSFVDWVGYKLMKVSMDFLVTARMQVGPTPNVVSDGLFNSVARDLGILRRMATNKYPVTLEGFDDILSVQMARSKSGQPRGIEFVIQDLNITAGRRTVDINTGLAENPSNIAAAQVSLTLQEIPIETVTIVKLPPLNLGTPLIGKKGGGGGGVVTLGLQSSVLGGLKWAVP